MILKSYYDRIQIVVIDSSNFIGSLKIFNLAEGCATVENILEECKSTVYKTSLSIIFLIEILEPIKEIIEKISTYARLTGDNQKLSFTDVQLVALASTLEHAAHGSRHLYIEHCQNEKKYILEKDNLRFSFDAIHISDLSKILGKKGLIVKNYENKVMIDFNYNQISNL